jgi:uncharacterized damage-inducible protein DinB
MQTGFLRHIGAAAALSAFLLIPAPALAQDAGALKAQYQKDTEAVAKKILDLSEAMGTETYEWRPMEGVRTVSEVFMLIAAEFYLIPPTWGAAPADGVPTGNTAFGTLTKISDKAQVVDHVKKSAAYFARSLEQMPAAKLGEKIQFFGQERTVQEALFLIVGDMHEHLGQGIAYARMNKVVPPWSVRSGS